MSAGVMFFFEGYGNHRDLHVLTHSFPTRRSSDLVEQQAVREALSPAGRELPFLALDVVDGVGTGPGQQRRDHEANSLARARRREGHDVLRAIIVQVVYPQPAGAAAARLEPPGPLGLLSSRPASCAADGEQEISPCPPPSADP